MKSYASLPRKQTGRNSAGLASGETREWFFACKASHFSAYLHDRCTNASIKPNPVDGWNDPIARDRAEYDGTQPVPLLSEVTGVDLSKEDGQDHCEHGD